MNQAPQRATTPKPREFQSEEAFWRLYEKRPELFPGYDATRLLAFAQQVRQSVQQRAHKGNKTASKNGTKREETGGSMALTQNPLPAGEDGAGPLRSATANGQKVGPGNPPLEHRFQKGDPGGPGRPSGPKSMRRIIRSVLFDDNGEGNYANAITLALFQQALKGNTHAIRIIVENGNNRRKPASRR